MFSDDFELDRSWTADPSGTDTAFTGRWERAVPQATSNKGLPLQLGAARSGTHDLVTGAAAGNSVGANDIDGGVSSIVSPPIELPTGQITLSLAFYLAHLANSSDDDFLRVQVLGTTTQTVLQELGCGTDRGADWQSTSVDISAFSGHTVRILIDAADAPRASLVEAAVDDVTIETLF